MIWKIALKSLLHRKTTTILTVLSLAISVVLLLGIERIRTGTKKSFEQTVSQVDLIVGARSSSINLLLYSVFRLGDPTNNISYDTYKKFSANPDIAWTIPISLGDSHRGFRVVGTSLNYFKHYRYSGKRELEFENGTEFKNLFDVVLGSEVAKKLNYKLGDKIVLTHGTGGVSSISDHSDSPFTIVGVLDKTGTPVDASLHVSLEAIESIHVGWEDGAPPKSAVDIDPKKIAPKSITAFFLRLKSKIGIFRVQREINQYVNDPMSAIIPGVSLRQLWRIIGPIEMILLIISFFVLLVSVVGQVLVMLTAMNERRREMAILRANGASPSFIASLFLLESFLVGIIGVLVGLIFTFVVLALTRPIWEGTVGFSLQVFDFTSNDFIFLAAILAGSVFGGLIPSVQAYRKTLADGLTIRL